MLFSVKLKVTVLGFGGINGPSQSRIVTRAIEAGSMEEAIVKAKEDMVTVTILAAVASDPENPISLATDAAKERTLSEDVAPISEVPAKL